jgi:membrane protein implicated in regulation of membrane protease activity
LTPDWLAPVGPWHWLVLGLVLAGLELTTPAFLFLPMGIGAFAAGLTLALIPGLPWTGQLGIFAAVSVISVLVGRLYLRRHPIASDKPTLNRRGHQYVGRVFTLETPIVNGVGKVRVDDSTWKIVGPDTPAGIRVRVNGVEGTVLRIEAAGGRPDVV